MTTLPPHPGLSGLAAREAATPAEVALAADDDADHEGLTHAEWAAVNAHLRMLSVVNRARELEPCGCCGPQMCCCQCHQEGQ